MSCVIVIDIKHRLPQITEWLERNVGPVINDSDVGKPIGLANMPAGEHWKLVYKPTRYTGSKRWAVEFDDTADESIILYFALRWA